MIPEGTDCKLPLAKADALHPLGYFPNYYKKIAELLLQ